jgi:hypothetical protein
VNLELKRKVKRGSAVLLNARWAKVLLFDHFVASLKL